MKTLFAWDFHGTLEQGTERVLAEIGNALCQEFGLDIHLDEAFIANHPSFTWRSLFEKLADGKLSEEQLREISERAYSDEFFPLNYLYMNPQPSACEVLGTIQKRGDVNILVSNSRPELIARYAEVIQLHPYFDAILGIEKLDPSIARRHNVTELKSVEIREYLEDHPGLFDRVVMIGNSEKDVRAGQQVDAITFLYQPNADVAQKCKPDYTIDDLTNVLTFLS